MGKSTLGDRERGHADVAEALLHLRDDTRNRAAQHLTLANEIDQELVPPLLEMKADLAAMQGELYKSDKLERNLRSVGDRCRRAYTSLISSHVSLTRAGKAAVQPVRTMWKAPADVIWSMQTLHER